MISTLDKGGVLHPHLDVSGLSLGALSTFIPPTNKASFTNYHSCISIKADNIFSYLSASSFSHHVHHPWLPISKGNIKKFAQTRFVNSSPNSYRLMPASVETSNRDKTSFVEKSSHKSFTPVSYFLEVAKLWALSNRSELECTFTLANTEDLKTTSAIELVSKNDRRRPICHVKQNSQSDIKSSELIDISAAEKELLQSVNRFLTTCDKKDKSSILNQGKIVLLVNESSCMTKMHLFSIINNYFRY